MKKTLLSLVLLVVGAISSNAATTNITSRFTYCWNKNQEKIETGSDGSITYTAVKYGGLAAYYGDEDLSGFCDLIIEFKSAPTVGTQLVVQGQSGNLVTGAAEAGANFLICNLDGADLSHVKQIALQCTTEGGGTIEISRICFRAFTYSATGKDVSYDEWGCILSSALSDFNEYDKVVFSYSVAGAEGHIGWGCGKIESRKGNVKVGALSVQHEGENNFTCTIHDLRAALEDGPDQYNIQGISFSVWSGEYTTSRTSVKVYPAIAPVTIGEYGWATFSSNEALDFSAVKGLTANIVTGHTGSAITKEAVKDTPANTGLLLSGEAGNYEIPVIASSTTNVSANLLKAGTGAAVSAESGKTKYVLGVTAGKAEFQKINTTAATVPTGKAYLEFNEAIEARSLDIDEGGTTAIDVISKKQDVSGEYYDLQGRRVAQPKKGLYIVNGKKVIIK